MFDETMAGYSCDVMVTFAVSGTFCFWSWWLILVSFIELTVLFTIASTFIDLVFSKALPSFYVATHTSDTAEWAIETVFS